MKTMQAKECTNRYCNWEPRELNLYICMEISKGREVNIKCNKHFPITYIEPVDSNENIGVF